MTERKVGVPGEISGVKHEEVSQRDYDKGMNT